MEPVVMIPVGYAKEQEVQTKKRKSLDEILF
jgi:nitroreductase